MIGRRLVQIAVVAATVAALAPTPAVPQAAAFCAGGQTWPQGGGHVGWASGIPAPLLGAAKNGITGWNGIANSTWNMSYLAPGPLGPPAPGSGWFSMSNPAGGFGGAPAVTLRGANGNTLIAVNTYLDKTWSWNAAGNFDQGNKVADMTTVVLHETGHWFRLVHPEQCPAPFTAAEQLAVMHVTWTVKWAVQPDDKAGAAALY